MTTGGLSKFLHMRMTSALKPFCAGALLSSTLQWYHGLGGMAGLRKRHVQGQAYLSRGLQPSAAERLPSPISKLTLECMSMLRSP